MERYLGMDVHSVSCTFCVLDQGGKQVRRDVIETNGSARCGYLKQTAGRLHLCFEESEWAGWLHESLSPHVAELVVMRGEWKPGPKSDAIDAHGLADSIRTGRFGRTIFKPPLRYAKLRELARVYGLRSSFSAPLRPSLTPRFAVVFCILPGRTSRPRRPRRQASGVEIRIQLSISHLG